MKKLLYLTVLLLGFAACNNEENEDVSPETAISNLISDLGTYNPNAVTDTLVGKRWLTCAHVEYEETLSEIIIPFFPLGGPPSPGGAIHNYVFHADGTLEDFTDAEDTPEEEYRVRTWTFDPETRTLTIDGTLNYHLIALGEENFIWDYIDTWSSDHPRYFREVFKARAIE